MSPVKRQKETKLKWVLDQLPHGYLIDTRTLKHHDIDRKLVHKYIESGWLEPVVHGLYRRPDVSEHSGTSWQTIIRSLQHIMDYSSVVGGRTALEAQGFSHYLKLGRDPIVHLYGDRHPTWLKRLSSKTNYVLHGRGLFDGKPDEYSKVETSAGPLLCSSRERAVLEMLDELPSAESFHIVDTIFEGLDSARPTRLEVLLHACRSVKVKRLFFVFADRHALAWRKYIDREAFDLGRGDRALVQGGKLHPLYRITVPADLLLTTDGNVQDA